MLKNAEDKHRKIRVYAWVGVVEDLSGYQVVDEDCLDIDNPPETLKNIVVEAGRIYAPYLIGNAQAVMEKADKLEMELDGQPWEQTPFTYQAKCLQWLREAYEALSDKDRGRVDGVLEGTGVLQILT